MIMVQTTQKEAEKYSPKDADSVAPYMSHTNAKHVTSNTWDVAELITLSEYLGTKQKSVRRYWQRAVHNSSQHGRTLKQRCKQRILTW